MMNTRKLTIAAAMTMIGSLVIALAYLVYPGTPSGSAFLAFDGFIELPRGGPLTILDYLTLNDRTLFVTSESSGALFAIALDSGVRAAGAVSEMPGSGAAHGVAVLPEQSIAFITRSEEHAGGVFDP